MSLPLIGMYRQQ